MSDALITLSKSCKEVAAELLAQPEFFVKHREDLPAMEQDLPQPDRYSGARSDDEETNLRVGAMRMLGFSDRAIERECGVDRRTIPHRLAWLEQTKRIPAVKDRILAVTANNAETSALVLADLLNRATKDISTEMAAMIKAVATAHGITVEKLQLLTGSPTEILEQRAGAGRAEIEAWWRDQAVPVEATVTSDAASAEKAPEPKQIAAAAPAGHVPDTSASPDARSGAAAQDPPKAGGGAQNPPGPGKADGSTAS